MNKKDGKRAREKIAELFVVLLAFLIALLTVSPVLKGGADKVFFSIDPDVVYTANALLYIKSGYISYFDHPGTPAIVSLSIFLAPFRLYAKFIEHTSFTTWVFNHYVLTVFYLRISQSVLLFISLLILAGTVKLLTKKTMPIILLFLALLSFGSFYSLGLTISADTFAFFITSIWLLVLSVYITRRNTGFLILLSLIAGLAFAARATTFFLLPASLSIVFMQSGGFVKKVLSSTVSAAAAGMGFVVGVSPVRAGFLPVLLLVFSFASSTGVHLSGGTTLFNYQTFINSANTLLHGSLLVTGIIIISLTLAVTYLLRRKKTYREVACLILIFFLGIIIFAKFPLFHYQIPNYLVIVFSGSVLMSALSRKMIYITIIALLFLAVPVSRKYLSDFTLEVNQAGYLEKFVKNNPPRYASVWEWAHSKEFAYLWNRDYTNGIFDEELSLLPQKIYQLRPNPVKIDISYETRTDLFNVCWDQMYVQEPSLEGLLNQYPILSRSVQKIPGSNLYLIRSDHCSE